METAASAVKALVCSSRFSKMLIMGATVTKLNIFGWGDGIFTGLFSGGRYSTAPVPVKNTQYSGLDSGYYSELDGKW